MNSRFTRKIKVARHKFNSTFNANITREREEILINRLQTGLGKSRNEIKSMIGDGLISLLAQVPFNTTSSERN